MEIYHPRDEELMREMRRVRRSAKRRRLIWGFVIWLVLSIVAGIILFNQFYMLSVIQGAAMGDTLPTGSLVLVRRSGKDTQYTAGDILLYEKTVATPLNITVLSPKGKIRDYCKYIIFRDLGTTRQYLARNEGKVTWVTDQSKADEFESDPDGNLAIDTEGMPNGEYMLKEVYASYGQDILRDPIPFNVNNPILTQIKRVLAAPGDRIILSPYQDIRINSRGLNRTFTSGRGADVSVDTRRVNVSDGEYFVQGDQLSLSKDSRETEFGNITQDEVLGRAEFALWPIRCFGNLTGTVVTDDAVGQGGAE